MAAVNTRPSWRKSGEFQADAARSQVPLGPLATMPPRANVQQASSVLPMAPRGPRRAETAGQVPLFAPQQRPTMVPKLSFGTPKSEQANAQEQPSPVRTFVPKLNLSPKNAGPAPGPVLATGPSAAGADDDDSDSSEASDVEMKAPFAPRPTQEAVIPVDLPAAGELKPPRGNRPVMAVVIVFLALWLARLVGRHLLSSGPEDAQTLRGGSQ
eukprot:gb/GFBE01019976.1/.p1 GENE.gb/GFBE01019976.1/~~gb/GFBE01019976.1/.p1  ORF type:complete len:212 (+),score=26.32 gb/GFBE01019976.1/:1-636(+)